MKKHLIDLWRDGQRLGYSIAEVKRELERLGFEVTQGSKHWKAKHPKLSSHLDFGMRILTINAHYRGEPGAVHPDAIKDIVKAVKWIEDNG
jgi:hypothetical protein